MWPLSVVVSAPASVRSSRHHYRSRFRYHRHHQKPIRLRASRSSRKYSCHVFVFCVPPGSAAASASASALSSASAAVSVLVSDVASVFASVLASVLASVRSTPSGPASVPKSLALSAVVSVNQSVAS